jgi:hypothetical protein
MIKELDELRASILALTTLLHAIVETHPNPVALRQRFHELSEQAMASLLATSSDQQTRVAEGAFEAMNAWLADLAHQGGGDEPCR